MKRTIVVELLEEHSYANFYTIRFADEEVLEFDKFYNEYDNDEYGEDLDLITYWIDKIGEHGAIERFFRPEGGNLKALPIETSKLRQFVFKITDGIIIIGNGGIKRTETYEEDPHLKFCAETLRSVGKRLMASVRNGDTCIYQNTMYEKLEFTIEIPDEKTP